MLPQLNFNSKINEFDLFLNSTCKNTNIFSVENV